MSQRLRRCLFWGVSSRKRSRGATDHHGVLSTFRNTAPVTLSSCDHIRPRFFSTSHIVEDHDDVPILEPLTTSLTTSQSNATTLSRTNEWKKSQLDSMAVSIQQNVKQILQYLDQPRHLSSSTSTSSRSTSNHRYLRRWEARFLQETRTLPSKRNIRCQKTNAMTNVSDLWDDALARAGRGSVTDGHDVDDDDHLHHRDDQLLASSTPIFGLPLNNQLVVEDLDDWIVSREDALAIEESDDDVHPGDNPEHHAELHLSTSANHADKGTDNEVERRRQQLYQEAALRAISLLAVVDASAWWKYDNDEDNKKDGIICEFGDEDGTAAQNTNALTVNDSATLFEPFDIHELLSLLSENGRVLSTCEANLILAHLATSPVIDASVILDQCLHMYREMTLSAELGQTGCIPDETTHRVLLAAFNGRLMAYGEAIQMTKSSVKATRSIVTPHIFYEGMKACHIKMDISSATEMMDLVLSSKAIRPSLGSIALLLDMMKAQNLRDKALALLDRVQQENLLLQDAQDRLLVSLCEWPARSRGGERIDLSSFYREMLTRLERSVWSGSKCGVKVFAKLIERMEREAKSDESLWNPITAAMRTLLDAYPHYSPSWTLTGIGLEASRLTRDPDMAATILGRQEQGVAVSYKAYRTALEICLRSSNAQAAESIIEALNLFQNNYPDEVLLELHGLALLCHTKAGDADTAMRCLESMIAKNMNPGDTLFGAVLHCLATQERHEEVESLFREMKLPKVASFDALLVSRLRTQSWDEAISIFEEMKQMRISPSPQTIQGVLIAKLNKGSRSVVITTLEALLMENTGFDENTFRLSSKILFRDVKGTLDGFRQELRDMGDADTRLKVVTLNLIRSIRIAEVKTKGPSKESGRLCEQSNFVRGQQEWKEATRRLFEMVEKIELLERQSKIE